ncbi:MAG: hypothetical protein N2112_15250 [Gemmataceae bacterium]|jgi:hypothetical protein|nr:hypothetical protein [Gemmataceae bacterium]
MDTHTSAESQLEHPPRESIVTDSRVQADIHKWIESEKAGHDLGEQAVREWVHRYWWRYLRARWMEHLEGVRFWIELDRGDFGLLRREFGEDTELMHEVFRRLKRGAENLDIIKWAYAEGLPMDRVCNILTSLDMNSRRLCCTFGNNFLS